MFAVPLAAALFSLVLAVASLVRTKRSPAGWWFFAGMVTLGFDSLLTVPGLRSADPRDLIRWLTLSFIVKSFVPLVWLGFSLTYSRGAYRQFLVRWRLPLAISGLLPIAAYGFRDQLFRMSLTDAAGSVWQLQFGPAAKVLNVLLLVALVLILMNLEQTFRAAVGTMRWRIKFVVLGLAVIFGARFYVRSQAILFSAPDISLWGFESGALLVGCVFLALAYSRTGWGEIDVYPSLAVLQSSLTILIVGAYLFIVGVLAQAVARFGGAEIFQFQAFVVLLGMAGLAVLLLSDRARQRLDGLLARHFKKAQHDSVRIWTLFSQQLAAVKDPAGLCAVSAKLISEIFEVLSVSVWMLDEEKSGLVLGASTSRRSPGPPGGAPADTASGATIAALRLMASPFDLDAAHDAWAEELRQLNPSVFANGGNRMCVPLRAGEEAVGAFVLADRVGGAPYSVEELELLKCIGDHVTSLLLNLRLANEVARARELEAFRTMSTFFVHDLKNTAASLNLMLKNLPVHFDDPAYRRDALRGIANTARRIDDMIGRLSTLRQRPDLTLVHADLNQLVSEALERVDGMPSVELVKDLHPLPAIFADREQIQSVVTNLVLNARDAVGAGGRIRVRTEHQGDRVLLSVADDGCGMSEAFLKQSLFRPFQSTKRQGLGIGLFQSRAIVQAHGGGMQVASEVGQGTTFLVTLPVTGRTS